MTHWIDKLPYCSPSQPAAVARLLGKRNCRLGSSVCQRCGRVTSSQILQYFTNENQRFCTSKLLKLKRPEIKTLSWLLKNLRLADELKVIKLYDFEGARRVAQCVPVGGRGCRGLAGGAPCWRDNRGRCLGRRPRAPVTAPCLRARGGRRSPETLVAQCRRARQSALSRCGAPPAACDRRGRSSRGPRCGRTRPPSDPTAAYRRCRGRSRRGLGRAPDRAAPACRGNRANRGRNGGDSRVAAPAVPRRTRTRGSTSRSRTRTAIPALRRRAA